MAVTEDISAATLADRSRADRTQTKPAADAICHRRGRGGGRAVYSAIDLGTNNCRLLVASPTRYGFKPLDAFSRIVGLGEGLGATGRLSPAAMDRALDALEVCARKNRRRRVTRMRAVATEACRSAANCDDFVARVRERTGLELDIISPAEEARLAVIGCQTLIRPRYRHVLVFDIGGGSTELILVRQKSRRKLRIVAWTSMPFGVINLSESFREAKDGAINYDVIADLISDRLARFEVISQLSRLATREPIQLIGTSGTVTTLTSVALGLTRYDRSRVDGSDMDITHMHRLARDIGRMPAASRAAIPCIGHDRADLIVAGCAVLDSILEAWRFDILTVADRGIREGILRGLMGSGQVLGPDPARAAEAVS